ncbi:hypothetical protein F4808DRAFT_249411 [Astrocystis sublimbata]|nr:hypothetical protein F4808DRAFT_249411 [Astrocystis sublimbata]
MAIDYHHEPEPAGDIGNHALPKAIVIITGVLALGALLTRLTARKIMHRLGLADLLLVISMIFYIVHHYNAWQVSIYPGLGVHQWQFNPELAKASNYNFKIGSIFFGLNIVFLKIAILMDWLYVFVPAGTRNGLFWILQTLIWGNAVFYFIGTFIEAFQCPPQDVGTSRCNIDVAKYNVASGVINVVSDLTILIAPHWVIWKLNLSRARKIGVSVLFLVGALATGSAIGRVIAVTNAYATGDILYHSVEINLWAMAEQTFGYLVIGIPALPKVLHDFPCARYLGSLVRTRTKHHSSAPSGYPPRTMWPSSTPRRHNGGDVEDVWDAEDTHVLVTVAGGDSKDAGVLTPGPAHLQHHHHRGRDDSSRNSSVEAVDLAYPRS